jgi:hypothetical protein
MKKELGYDINTGEKIYHPSHMMVHTGNGYYQKACDITEEDLKRRARFFASIDKEVQFKRLGFDEA